MKRKDQNELVSEAEEDILDAFFQFRKPLPENGMMQANLSTAQIHDELQEMYSFTQEQIIAYMKDHDYSPITEPDGSVKWAIWRAI